MKMKPFIVSLIILAFSSPTWSEIVNWDGRLIYGGQGIYSMKLTDGKSTSIMPLPNSAIDNIDRVDSHRLLVSSFNLSPMQERSRIEIFDCQSNTLKSVALGSRGVYVPAFKKIVFYDKNAQLSIADIGNSIGKMDVIDTGVTSAPSAVVLVSSREFLYESELSGTNSIWKYDMESEDAMELGGLNNCSLNHAIWRSSTSELLCSEMLENGQLSGRYFLTNLSGENRRRVDFGEGRFWPVTYIGKIDAIVLQERKASLSKGERHPVHIYEFSTNLKTQVSDNNLLGNRIIYVED